MTTSRSNMSAKKDRFLFLPLLMTIVIIVTQSFLFYWDVSSVLAIPGALVSLIAEIIFLFIGIAHIFNRRYRAGFSFVLIIPALMFWAGVPFIYGGYAQKVGRYAKFVMKEDQYIQAVRNTKPGADGLRFTQFLWGGGMLNPVFLVYDESDELVLPADRQSYSWRKKTEDSEFSHCRYRAQGIKSHFYVVDFGC